MKKITITESQFKKLTKVMLKEWNGSPKAKAYRDEKNRYDAQSVNNRYYYRVSAKEDSETVIYTKSIVGVKQLEDLIRGNGYTPQVQRLTKLQIPMSEIRLVNELNESRTIPISESKLREIIHESIIKILKNI